jgi:hypothetical protein
MVNVRIEHKSGKVEFVEMDISNIQKNLVSLVDEGRLVRFSIQL